MVGQDPLLMDPEQGDYRLQPGSPALGYGCQTFPSRAPSGSASPLRTTRAPWFDSTDDTSPSRGHARGRDRTVIVVGGTLTEETSWDADTVRVIDDVVISDGITLSVDPGVVVLFEGHFALEVQGTIRALGSAPAPVLFTSAAPELFAIDSTTAGSWFGLRFDQTAAANDSSLLDYCIVEYCKAAGDGSRGAALSLTGFSNLRISNCVFRHNVADYGSVAYCANFSAPEFVGCVMTDNHAFVSGSAIYCLDSFPALSSNTIVDNHVLNEEIFDEAGVIHNHLSKSRPVGCIIRGNTSHYFLGGQIREPKLFYTIYNNIEGGHPGEGNFDADPIFVDHGTHPFGLQEDSPCIDQGPPDTVGLHLPLFDLAGHERVYNDRVDVGAYEWLPVAGAPDAAETESVLRRQTPSLAASPNPCRRGTGLELTLPARVNVQVWIADVTGRRIATLWNGELPAGSHTFEWSPRFQMETHPIIASAGAYWGIARVVDGQSGPPTPVAILSTRIMVVP